MRRRTLALLAPALLAAPALSACGRAAGSAGTPGAAPAGEGATLYPREIANCEAELLVPAIPQRVLLLESASVTILDALGVLSAVIGRAGSFPAGYYDEDLAARIAEIPALSEDIDASGHLMISAEMVIAQSPDLVLGLPDGLTREGLADAGAQVLIPEAYCTAGEPASLDDLAAQISVYGEIFDRPGRAAEVWEQLSTRIADARERAAALPRRTAAVLYPSVGGGPLYAYGAASMATPQLAAAGLDNVFAASAERVFEVGAEALLAADPDVLILLHQGQEDAAVIDEVRAVAGLDALAALASGAVLPLLFNFTEPASPLIVDGLARILDLREGMPA